MAANDIYIARASPDKDELLVTELDMDRVRQLRDSWQFFRDRRPEAYGPLVELLTYPKRGIAMSILI